MPRLNGLLQHTQRAIPSLVSRSREMAAARQTRRMPLCLLFRPAPANGLPPCEAGLARRLFEHKFLLHFSSSSMPPNGACSDWHDGPPPPSVHVASCCHIATFLPFAAEQPHRAPYPASSRFIHQQRLGIVGHLPSASSCSRSSAASICFRIADPAARRAASASSCRRFSASAASRRFFSSAVFFFGFSPCDLPELRAPRPVRHALLRGAILEHSATRRIYDRRSARSARYFASSCRRCSSARSFCRCNSATWRRAPPLRLPARP